MASPLKQAAEALRDSPGYGTGPSSVIDATTVILAYLDAVIEQEDQSIDPPPGKSGWRNVTHLHYLVKLRDDLTKS